MGYADISRSKRSDSRTIAAFTHPSIESMSIDRNPIGRIGDDVEFSPPENHSTTAPEVRHSSEDGSLLIEPHHTNTGGMGWILVALGIAAVIGGWIGFYDRIAVSARYRAEGDEYYKKSVPYYLDPDDLWRKKAHEFYDIASSTDLEARWFLVMLFVGVGVGASGGYLPQRTAHESLARARGMWRTQKSLSCRHWSDDVAANKTN